MKASEIQKGMTIIYTSNDYPQFNNEFVVENVTDKRISWFTGHPTRSNKNIMKMAWVTKKQFQSGLDSGAYKIK